MDMGGQEVRFAGLGSLDAASLELRLSLCIRHSAEPTRPLPKPCFSVPQHQAAPAAHVRTHTHTHTHTLALAISLGNQVPVRVPGVLLTAHYSHSYS